MNACSEKIRKKDRGSLKVQGPEKTSREAPEKTYCSGRIAGGGAYRRPYRGFRGDFLGAYLYPLFG
jgi:hypothetical protein